MNRHAARNARLFDAMSIGGCMLDPGARPNQGAWTTRQMPPSYFRSPRGAYSGVFKVDRGGLEPPTSPSLDSFAKGVSYR